MDSQHTSHSTAGGIGRGPTLAKMMAILTWILTTEHHFVNVRTIAKGEQHRTMAAMNAKKAAVFARPPRRASSDTVCSKGPDGGIVLLGVGGYSSRGGE